MLPLLFLINLYLAGKMTSSLIFTLLGDQKWDLEKNPLPKNSKASEQTGAGTHRADWAYHFLPDLRV